MSFSSLQFLVINVPHLTIIANAVDKAGRKLIREYGEVEHLQVSKKGPGNFVSHVDKSLERLLQHELSKAKPDIGFLMEEKGTVMGKNARYRFVIDPLDGTTNFLHSLPHFCISVSLEEHGEPIAAVTYDPLRQEMFYAAKGRGAYMNDRRLRVSARTNLATCLMTASRPHLLSEETKDHKGALEGLNRLIPHMASCRNMGSAALDLAYLAAGRVDAFLGIGLSRWDISAGILFIKEAGGSVKNAYNKDISPHDTTLFAANADLAPKCHALMMEDVSSS